MTNLYVIMYKFIYIHSYKQVLILLVLHRIVRVALGLALQSAAHEFDRGAASIKKKFLYY